MARSRRLLIHLCLWLSVCFVMPLVASAAPYEVHFHSGTVTPAPGWFDLPAGLEKAGGRAHALVQLDDYLQKGQREALAAAGVELLAYLPDRAYVAAVTATADAATLPALGVRHLSPLAREYKLHPRVTARSFGSWSEFTAGRRVFAVEIMPDVPLAEAQAQLEQAGCEVGDWLEAAHTLIVAFAPEQAPEIAGLDAVLFVDETPPPMDMVNDQVRARIHVNELQTDPHNLSGNGVTILVYDGGMVDTTHPDFDTRATWTEDGAVAEHSTHVAGTVGGSGLNSGANRIYRGMAPQATIISGEYDACDPYCLYESPNDFEDDYSQARRDHGIELTTNSIGANIDPNQYPCDWFGDYESTSRLLDRLTHDTEGRPLTMFFAAGNERNGANCGATGFRCMSVPAGAKNVITVGATNSSNDNIAGFSSFGPTDDGRIKPEVCAPGVDVTSCSPGGGYVNMSGTSMATPATAGSACLILERWHALYPNAPDPLPETMKAILINSTNDIDAAGVDYRTGFGLVNALRAIENLNAGGVYEGSLDVEEAFSRTFTVPSGLTALDVSIAWSDVPAVGNVIPTLVNDLDLWLVDPNGISYLPWVLRANAPSTPAQTGRDSINVCERVHVASPVAGVWTLHVAGEVNSGTEQKFGLAANVALVEGWASIGGQVRNVTNSEGIPGRVSVIGEAQTALTDPQGNYDIAVPGNATYTLYAESYGFAALDTQVTVTTGNITRHLPLRAAANGTINGTVSNQFDVPLSGVTIEYRFPYATIPDGTSDAQGNFTAQLPGENEYVVMARSGTSTSEVTVFVPENGTATAVLTLFDPAAAPATDAYGYHAYEATDGGFPAVYDWLEISPQAGGPGTAITPGTGNDWVADVQLPFPMRFYGVDSTWLRVSADGWVGVGRVAHNNRRYVNQPIPTDTIPNGIICVFWDDLNPAPTGEGDLSYYLDQANGRFIIEYRNVRHYTPTTNHVTAQLIIWDQSVRPTVTGDNEFQIQYQAVDYEGGNPEADADATVGIEDYEGDGGLQVVYGGQYNPNCSTIGAQYAIRFTTTPILGYGCVGGTIVMVPPVADITQVDVSIAGQMVHPNAQGAYLVDSVMVGTHELLVTYTGYETGRTATLTIIADDTVAADYELHRLDPARNLAGEYVSGPNEIRLRWDWPVTHQGVSGGRGEGMLDDFSGFRVWQSGNVLATVNDTFYVHNVTQSGNYNFWVTARYEGGESDTSNHYRVTVSLAVDPEHAEIPSVYYLKQNYPNPFNPTTRIQFGLPQASPVRVEVFDVLGRTVARLVDGTQSAGTYTVTFDASGLGSGIYYCRMQAGSFTQVQKMMLMR